MSEAGQISFEWRRWIAENLMLGVDAQAMLDILVSNGIEAIAAARELQTASAHPYVHAGNQLVQLSKKIESLLQIRRELGGLLSGQQAIERRTMVSGEEFLRDYYAANRPVVLTDAITNWRALSAWTPEYFKEQFGGVEIEVTADRSLDQNYERNVERHRRRMTFSDYVDRVLAPGESNDIYMVANNHTFERLALCPLLNDIELPHELLDADAVAHSTFLWFGPAGTVTPLHHDPLNVLLAQVRGRKRVRMFPPAETPRLYNYVGVFSEVDCEKPDLRRFPLYGDALSMELVLEPGEALFIPVGWWHHVRALDLAISVSFTNFRFPNHYTWSDPNIRR